MTTPAVGDVASRLCDALPQADTPACGALATALVHAWSEPQRAYHTMQHLSECLVAFDAVRDTLIWPEAVLLALLFHDAVYDPQRHDNEALSAAWALESLPGLGAPLALAQRVAALVMATLTHRPEADDPQAADTLQLLDIDLAILGSTPARFAEYEAQIRREYAFVPGPQYIVARAKVMRGFAQRQPLFHTAYFQQRLEAAARRNLAVFA